ncbi:MAG: exonuclease domain-containing protein [Burkholderiales bacterium]
MLDRSLVFLDVETTGATPHSDRITEIGMVDVANGKVLHEWSSLVNPGMAIPQTIQSLTGITDAMVADAPAFADLADDLHRRLEGKILVAHNARFDHGFLKNEFRRLGMRYQPEVLCTVKLSRKLFPDERRHNLDSLIARHGLHCENRHRALADARALWHFTQKIYLDLDAGLIQLAVEELLKTPSLPPGLEATVLENIPEGAGVYVFFGENDIPLYVGKSTNLRARVLSHFQSDHRAAKIMRFSKEITRIETIETAGELGALVREAQLVRHLSPVHNRRVRRNNELCAFHWDPVDGPRIPATVGLQDVILAETSNLYGTFRSRRAAFNALREIADEYQLCHIATGLEKGSGPCLANQLNQCRGYCIGRETEISHSMRMTEALQALKLQSWPFAGRIGLREHDAGVSHGEVHVLDHWCYVGTLRGQEDIFDVMQTRHKPTFDYDTYKILTRYFKSMPRNVEIVPLP